MVNHWGDKIINQMSLKKKTDSKIIFKWLEDHPIISGSVLASLSEIDINDFGKMRRGERPIPAKKIEKIETILKKYGYRGGSGKGESEETI